MKAKRLLYLCCVTTLVAAAAATAYSQEFSVDFSRPTGEIRPLNGVNLWAPLSCETLESHQADAEECFFSTVRLHDVPWDNNGLRLVDVHQIFGNLDADPGDPKNYFCAPTDDYIANILKGGATPIYRLGTSIEHSTRKYFAKKPDDMDRYAEICAAIVRHYNAGWANGFEWNLPYWEIWNEPDLVPQMWDDRDWNSYCRFYVVVAKRLRKEFPNIKIGGPALTHAGYDMIGRLADLCKQEGAPLDFVSWHCYARTPEELLDPPAKMREVLDAAGFPDAELHLNEWHYFPCTWEEIQHSIESKVSWYARPDGTHGYVSAAFNDFVLTRWQDTPLTMSNYYSFTFKDWGTIDADGLKRPTYYSLKLFGELVRYSPKRVQTTDGGGSVALLGGTDADGANKRLLVSVFRREETAPLEIALTGVPEKGSVGVAVIGKDGFQETQLDYADGVLKLDSADSGVYLVRF